MVIEQLVLKEKSPYLFKSSVFLKDFNETKLKIARRDCVDKVIYHVYYAKEPTKINPLYLIIPEFYGCIKEHESQKYLIMTPIELNDKFLLNYKKIWDEIIVNINKINNFEYNFKEGYYKIKIGNIKHDDSINSILNKLIKISAAKISCRLIIEKNNSLFLETYLEECLYDKIQNGYKVIKNKN